MNVYTEDEAAEKWCPFGGVVARCLASKCMAWRWESFASKDNPERLPGAGQSFDKTRGYCGLAGRP